MSKNNIVSYSLEEIRAKIAKGEDRTDNARLDAQTDEDIERAMRDDPDWADLINFDWSGAQMVFPAQKKSISIRLDEDVIDFFKKSGKGYQTRMNAVLRHYMKDSASKG